MMARLTAALVLLCACISLVAAHGTIVLNEVAPVSGDSVEIADDFFTPDGQVESIESQALHVLRQFDLLVTVPSVSLQGGAEGVTMSGALGTTLESTDGNVLLHSGRELRTQTSRLSSFSLLDVTLSGDSGVNVQSGMSTEFVGDTVSIAANGQPVDVLSDGPIAFLAPAGTTGISASGDVSFTQGRSIKVHSNIGDVEIATGGEVSVDTPNTISLDGHRGVTLASEATATLNAASGIVLAGEQFGLQSFGDVVLASTGTVNTIARHDVEIVGDIVELTGNDGVTIGATGLQSVVSLSSEAGTSITASLGTLELTSTLAVSEVRIDADESVTIDAPVFQATVDADANIGNVASFVVAFATGDEMVHTSPAISLWAGDRIEVDAGKDLTFQSLGAIESESYTFVLESDVDTLVEASASIRVEAGEDRDILFTSAQGGELTATAQLSVRSHSRATLQGGSVEGDAQLVLVEPFTGHHVEVSGGENVTFSSTTGTSFTGFDVNGEVAGEIRVLGNNWRITSQENIGAQIGGDAVITGQSFTAQSTTLGGSVGLHTDQEGGTVSIEATTSTVEGDRLTFNGSGDFTLSGTDITMDAEKALSMSSEQGASWVATSDITFDAGNGNLAFSSSHVTFDAAASSLTYAALENTKFDAEKLFNLNARDLTMEENGINSLRVSSTGHIDVDIGGSAQFVGTDAAQTATFDAQEELFFSGASFLAETSTLTLSSVEDFHSVVGTDYELTSDASSHAAIDGSSSHFFGKTLSFTSDDDLVANGGHVFVESGLLDDVSFTSATDLSITAGTTDDIGLASFVSRIFTVTAAGDGLMEGGEVEIDAVGVSVESTGDAITYDANEKAQIDTSVSLLYNSTDRDTTFKSADSLIMKSGVPDDVYVSSAENIDFVAARTMQVVSENDVGMLIRNNTDINAATTLIGGSDTVHVRTESEAEFLATGDITVSSGGGLHVSSGNEHSVFVYSDGDVTGLVRNELQVIADATTGCAIDIQVETDAVGQFSSSLRLVEILGEEGVWITSKDSIGDFGATDGAILFDSTHDITVAAEDGAAMFFAEDGFNDGFDGLGVRSMLLKTTDNDGNIEFAATQSQVYVYGNQGIESDANYAFDAFGDAGVDVLATGPIGDITLEGVDMYFDGNRGLNMSGGAVSPATPASFAITSFTGDMSFIADSALELLSMGTVSNPGDTGISITSFDNDISFEAENGHDVLFHAADSIHVTAAGTIDIEAFGGDVEIDTDVQDLEVTAQNLDVESADGSVAVAASGIGGSLVFTTTNMEWAADTIDIDTNGGAQFELSSFLADGQVIRLETDRPVDNIVFSSASDVSASSTTHVHLGGNNVEIEAANQDTDFTGTSLVVGAATNPIMSINADDLTLTTGDMDLETERIFRFAVDLATTLDGTDSVLVRSFDGMSFRAETDLSLTGVEADVDAEDLSVTAEKIDITASDGRVLFRSTGADTSHGIEFLSSNDLSFSALAGMGIDFNSQQFIATDRIDKFSVLATDISFRNDLVPSILGGPIEDVADDVDPGYVQIFTGSFDVTVPTNTITFLTGGDEEVSQSDIYFEAQEKITVTPPTLTQWQADLLNVDGSPISFTFQDFTLESKTVFKSLDDVRTSGSTFGAAFSAEGPIVLDGATGITADAQFITIVGDSITATSDNHFITAMDNITIANEGGFGGSFTAQGTTVELKAGTTLKDSVFSIGAGSDLRFTNGPANTMSLDGTLGVGIRYDDSFVTTTPSTLSFQGATFDVDTRAEESLVQFSGLGVLFQFTQMRTASSSGLTLSSTVAAVTMTAEKIEFSSERIEVEAALGITFLDQTGFKLTAGVDNPGDDAIVFESVTNSVEVLAGAATDIRIDAEETIGFYLNDGAAGQLQFEQTGVPADAAQGIVLASIHDVDTSFVAVDSDITFKGTTDEFEVNGGNRVSMTGPTSIVAAATDDFLVESLGRGGTVTFKSTASQSTSAIQMSSTGSMNWDAENILLETDDPGTNGDVLDLVVTSSEDLTLTADDVTIDTSYNDIEIVPTSANPLLFGTVALAPTVINVYGGSVVDIEYQTIDINGPTGAGTATNVVASERGSIFIDNNDATAIVNTADLSLEITQQGDGFDISIVSSDVLTLASQNNLVMFNEADNGDISFDAANGFVEFDSTSRTLMLAQGGVQYVAHDAAGATSGSIAGTTIEMTAGGPGGQVRLNADDDIEIRTTAHTTNSNRLGFFETTPVPQHVARDNANAPCQLFRFCGDLRGNSNDHRLGDAALSNALETVQNVAFAHGFIGRGQA